MEYRDGQKEKFEKLGIPGVKALLEEGKLLSESIEARTWMEEKKAEISQQREKEERQLTIDAVAHARNTAKGTWALAVATILLVLITLVIGWSQAQDAKESREQQDKDAMELIRVQVALEFDKAFDSVEMRNARRRLARQLLENKKVTEDRVADFFENVGLYMHKGRIDEDTVYNSYSVMIEGYWPDLPPVFRLPRGGFHATSFSFC
jgi:5'-3' exonuclease